MKFLVGMVLALAVMTSWASLDVKANGLFAGKAVLTINGAQHLLKEGETSPEGVKLISSNSKQAVIELFGDRQVLYLSQQISANYSVAKVSEVRIPSDASGHYFVGGAINGHHVQFMVDTGATVVAMNSEKAARLGIDLRGAKLGSTSTAGGIVQARYVNISKLTVGSISLPLVTVAVLDGGFPKQVLLGNSFLNRVEMRKEAGVLVLTKNN